MIIYTKKQRKSNRFWNELSESTFHGKQNGKPPWNGSVHILNGLLAANNASEKLRGCAFREKKANKTAIIWESETGEVVTYTYEELSEKVNQLANALNKLNIRKGDRVTIYMPLVPEAAIAMLACSRIGAIHSVVFGGFSTPSLAERIDDSKSKLIITAETAQRRGKTIPLRKIVDTALQPNQAFKHPCNHIKSTNITTK